MLSTALIEVLVMFLQPVVFYDFTVDFLIPVRQALSQLVIYGRGVMMACDKLGC